MILSGYSKFSHLTKFILLLAIIIQIIGPKGQIIYTVQGDTGYINYKKHKVVLRSKGVEVTVKYPKDHLAIIIDVEEIMQKQMEELFKSLEEVPQPYRAKI